MLKDQYIQIMEDMGAACWRACCRHLSSSTLCDIGNSFIDEMSDSELRLWGEWLTKRRVEEPPRQVPTPVVLEASSVLLDERVRAIAGAYAINEASIVVAARPLYESPPSLLEQSLTTPQCYSRGILPRDFSSPRGTVGDLVRSDTGVRLAIDLQESSNDDRLRAIVLTNAWRKGVTWLGVTRYGFPDSPIGFLVLEEMWADFGRLANLPIDRSVVEELGFWPAASRW